MDIRYFEDFHVNDTFDLGTTPQVTAQEIIAFASQFDPQPFHLDPEAAKASAFGQLVASGWHTVALLMRLLVDGLLNQTISMGSPGVDEVRWLRPLRPGDALHARFIVLDATPSRSKATMGIIRSRMEAWNQDDELVMTMVGIHFLGRRPA